MKSVKKLIAAIACLFCFVAAAQAQEEATSNATDNDTTIYTVVEKAPSFPRGETAMFMFLGQNIRYPQRASEDGYSGTVYVRFVVETDGTLTNIEVVKGVGGGCSEEAVRVVKMMPNWIPGENGGKKVRTSFTLPVKFKLHNDL